MPVRLFDWGPSPFCLKVRAILDYKGIAYQRVPLLGRAIFEVIRRGKIGKVPALEWSDGTFVVDSTDIALFLERQTPAPPILPASAPQQGLCTALEEWADEAIYFLGLRVQWEHPEAREMVPKAFGGGAGRAVYQVYRRRVHRQLVGQGTGRKPMAHVLADIERNLAAADQLVDGRRFLLGDLPYLCDFALMSQLVYLSRTPPGLRLVQRCANLPPYLERMRALRVP